MPELPEECGVGACVDNATVVLGAHDLPGGFGAVEGAVQVHLHYQVPVMVRHFLEGDVAEDAGVVYQHVDASKSVYGGLDYFVAVLD